MDVKIDIFTLGMKKTLMSMKRILFISALLTMCITLFAQTNKADSLQQEKLRQEIGWDYSVPDFSVTTIDESKMGSRNAAILRSLEKNYTQSMYNRFLSSIVVEQLDLQKYTQLSVPKLKLLSVSKQDDKMTIKVKVWLNPKTIAGKQADIVFSFIQGLSSSEQANYLFSNLGRYVQAKEKYDEVHP